ncbi:excalibur calcium-binding domain-containing protein [Hyphomonas chukchiensis]|mgnify:CR=1 FL=1|uniref:Excalibur calcium-binding domain-containing protein n=1 Tax=Hyphomonas chukchiensis TaxID=1280947 RepID=A0A062U907_9PROT|nr:excalibur calcium-binding domain-containing protein [Hyphomonas chukchiensis]KCZ56841.1 hypothetical protein HY30_06890 [Hyphomonas chukchiensis]
MRKAFAILILAVAWPLAAFAHGGGLNAEGCHTNRKTGDYHCHRTSAPAPARPTPRPATPAAPNALRGTPTVSGAYRNCTEARAAGAAPVRRGEPGYGAHLDRDNDGIGCE